jgi:hypothetical protein
VTTKERNIATKTGKDIVLSARKNSSRFSSIKRDLHMLEKASEKSVFLDRLVSIQFRHEVIVPEEMLSMLENVDFREFRAQCLLSAYQMYNSIASWANAMKSKVEAAHE